MSLNALSHEELTVLTGYKTKPAITEALRSMGITHKVRPDGFPIVSTAHIEKVFGGASELKQSTREPDYGAL